MTKKERITHKMEVLFDVLSEHQFADLLTYDKEFQMIKFPGGYVGCDSDTTNYIFYADGKNEYDVDFEDVVSKVYDTVTTSVEYVSKQIGKQVEQLIQDAGVSTYWLQERGISQRAAKALKGDGTDYRISTLLKLLRLIGGEIRIEG